MIKPDEIIEDIEDAVVEIIKAPIKIPAKLIGDFFDWLDGE